ncbi:MAG: hypothetical protein DBX62_01470 [Clostridia bacterium]|nr:MAG: hypothetical protein DBX62_01470 [Clostridia bacterium]
MNKTKRVLSVVLAVLMLSSLIAALAIAADDDVCNVVINYVFADSRPAANSWTARISKGESINQTVTSPTVVGYAPNQETVTINQVIDDHVTITVTYQPVEVDFTVKHYQQNVNDDKYILAETEPKKAFTESQVGDKLAKEYNGFTALLYDTTTKVAADGSTVVEIYYDRNYYLMSFNLNGGFGVEPIYARFGAALEVGTPTKPGYTFSGWEPQVPATVPAENTTHKAKWKVDDSVNYRVQYWQENANDDGFSYESSVQKKAAPGTVITAANDKNYTGFHYDHTDGATVAADGSSVVNVYYKRNTYTLTFKVNEGFIFDNWVTKAEFKNIKYGADTSPWWNQAPSGYLWHTTSSGSTFYTAAPYMPNSNLTIYGKKSSGMSTIHYYEKGTTTSIKPDLKVQNSGWSFTVEDYIEIPGFEYDSNKVQGNNYYLYYTRNSYKLDFNSANVIVRSNTIPYDKALSSYYFEPSYPTGILEEGGYVFAGWYTDPGCTEAVAWDTAKMPYNNTIFYAKWAPKNHTVKTFLTKEKIEENDPIDTRDNVPHGTAVTNTPADPQNGAYVFVGWFYMDGNVEKAFDFSMPVVKDLNLYAKWSSNTLVTYTIYYKSGDTEIAEPTTGSALAGTTLTFEAKTGDELNEGYQSGYFPHTGSHSLTMDINGNNEFTFVYVAKDKVNYTVKYLEKDTNKVLHDEKTAETTHAIITEKFEQKNGYAPDAYQKRLVLSATEAENVITFWYTKDDVHAPVQIVHWIQNIAGEGYTEYQSSVDTNAEINKTQTSTALTITGFEYKRGTAVAGENTTEFTAPTAPSGTLTAEGLVLNLYYDRIEYPYEFRFVDRDGNTIAEPKTGKARYQAQVTEAAKNLEADGWMLDGSQNGAITIQIEENINTAVKNVYVFKYNPFYKVVHVKSGTPDAPERIVIPNNNKDGLTDKVSDGYLYGGAFTDEACDANHVQTFTQGENAINFTPIKGETYYIWEVSETYLKPRAYAVWRHDPAHNGQKNVVGLYLTTSVDRNMYQQVGFAMENNVDILSTDGTVYTKVRAVYESGDVKEEMYVKSNGDLTVTQTATDEGKYGYVGIARKETNNTAQSFNYRPYWVTLDGIKVTSAYAERKCEYQGPGFEKLIMSELVKASSNVSVYASNSTRTVGVEGIALLSVATENVAAPEVPETPVIPEIPEAPDMTLNSGAMYLRAQYTYEMMSNTVKFISAIDVNECTEYGFVINGEVVKCEEAAQTVDGYDANYLFGGSVNGAMLMSCNMLLDGLVDGMTLNVTPYYVAADGITVVYGETRTLVYRQWVGLEG